jgi:hypothetical protein
MDELLAELVREAEAGEDREGSDYDVYDVRRVPTRPARRKPEQLA